VAQSRAMREHQLLRLMRALALHVPQPVASGHQSTGRTYRADIAVGWIPGSHNTVQLLRARTMPLEAWAKVGSTIRRMHDAQVFHSDLNAHNLLLADKGAAWIVDFDKCSFRGGGAWKTANLLRLRRSLVKEFKRAVADGEPWECTVDAIWISLVAGYRSNQDT
jgi:3-deoxy-D-manno-octulosonic-acid transferase